MKRLFQRLSRRQSPYDLQRVISRHIHKEYARAEGRLHVICDIDKTYLETKFENLRQLIRIPFEAPSEKITVAGASEFLLALRWGRSPPDAESQHEYPRGLHFVSSSPPQLRGTLQAKLRLDGLDWNSDTFKNQVYNLRRGRMDLLKHHVAYKSAAILQIVRTLPPESRVIFIGDNAESDSYIYFGISALLTGRLTPAGYATYLTQAGVDGLLAQDLERFVSEPLTAKVAAVLIRRAPGYSFAGQPPLNQLIKTFDNFYQAALLLYACDAVDEAALWPLTRRFQNVYGLPTQKQASWLQALKKCQELRQLPTSTIEQCLAKLGASAQQGLEALPEVSAATTDFLQQWGETEILAEARRLLAASE